MKKKKLDFKKLIFVVAITIFALLTILPMFINQYVGIKTESGIFTIVTTNTFYKLFDGRWHDLFNPQTVINLSCKGEFFFQTAKICLIASIVFSVAIAAFAILDFVGIKIKILELINKLCILAAIICGILILVCILFFFISSAENFKDLTTGDLAPFKSITIYGGWVWYVGFIAPIATGVTAFFNKK